MLPANEEDACPFGPQHPFVSIGREEVDRNLAEVERKNAEPLDRIEEEKRAAFVGQDGAGGHQPAQPASVDHVPAMSVLLDCACAAPAVSATVAASAERRRE